MIKRKDNPAKLFLRRYLALCGRIDALSLAISQAMDRATNTGISLKEIKVLSSPADHDPMARDICNAVDACEILYQQKAEAEKALREILSAINSVPDEQQKAILTMRYITGMGFREIKDKIHYEESQMFVIHGRALVEVNKWLKSHQKQAEETF